MVCGRPWCGCELWSSLEMGRTVGPGSAPAIEVTCLHTALCSEGLQCVSTPWLISAWSSMGLLLTRRAPTINGCPSQERCPILGLAQYVPLSFSSSFLPSPFPFLPFPSLPFPSLPFPSLPFLLFPSFPSFLLFLPSLPSFSSFLLKWGGAINSESCTPVIYVLQQGCIS